MRVHFLGVCCDDFMSIEGNLVQLFNVASTWLFTFHFLIKTVEKIYLIGISFGNLVNAEAWHLNIEYYIIFIHFQLLNNEKNKSYWSKVLCSSIKIKMNISSYFPAGWGRFPAVPLLTDHMVAYFYFKVDSKVFKNINNPIKSLSRHGSSRDKKAKETIR